MKRTLILHIGAHRTATSALQAYLHANFLNLQDKGFFYPYKVRRHLKMMNQIFNKKRAPADVAQDLNARADSKQNKTIHTIILSDEDVCMRRDLAPLATFRKWFDVKVVFTLRRQDTWLESWFFQNIKWQWNKKLSHCTFDEFLEMRKDFHWIHYDRYLQHLEKLFGQENIILNVHEKGQMKGGPIETFCDSVGLTDRNGFTAPAHMNESYSPAISEFMRCLPLDEAPDHYRGVLTTACARIDKKILGSQKKQSERLMPPDQRTAVMAEYEAGNRALAQRYFGRDDLFLEPLPAADAPLAKMELPADSYELMRSMVAPLISAIITQHVASEKSAQKADPGSQEKKPAETKT
ncbi:hypothetical protein PXK30_21045 [Phaeobacter gallaeciensis]|uniref:hypothetical protein n=1 Tax=Phaeobacter gallaeciensis TaxID=60890 RepID=UPI00237F09F9|nr:hypothetical protein [Phaeobacter gallaeciensis]MDE4306135.1 hypothetical protein [Phaeobacter gallaeciensis]MDE4310557.1 hypothetical protein [Phaeobacter gallaeciensis]MDE4315017.1 hypothetical protein [Phaeobacter gallaeciensis]MDE4319506.1 hypothetical protein [Phaeobacter gallaeciensis]MDE4323886.1 hypothetical protein [Phaeobacter gallaeciensis]